VAGVGVGGGVVMRGKDRYEGEAKGYSIYSTVDIGIDKAEYGARAENDFGKTVYHTRGYATRSKAVRMLILALGGALIYFLG